MNSVNEHWEKEKLELKKEIKLLSDQVAAWEATFSLGRNELFNILNTMNAQESLLNHSSEELKLATNTIKAQEELINYSNSELQNANNTILAQENVIQLSSTELKVLHTEIEKLLSIESLLESDIMKALNSSKNEKEVLSRLSTMDDSKNENFYIDVLSLLTGITFSREIANLHWSKILENKKLFESKMGREISFRTAMVDYFTYSVPELSNPKILEMNTFAAMIQNAVVDELTGLYNRRFLKRAIEKEMHRAVKHNHPLSLMVSDIDYFKKINDTYGHSEGDKVLAQIGYIIKSQIRKDDIACRFGGEEFLVLLPELNTSETFIQAEKLRNRVLNTPFDIPQKITMSFGISEISNSNFNDALIAADKALYLAKKSGRNKTLVGN